MTEEEQKEYDNAKEDYEELANSMSKQDLIDFYVEKMLEDNYVITERETNDNIRQSKNTLSKN